MRNYCEKWKADFCQLYQENVIKHQKCLLAIGRNPRNMDSVRRRWLLHFCHSFTACNYSRYKTTLNTTMNVINLRVKQ